MPVWGSACSQKYWKRRFCRSSRNASSCAEKAGRAGVVLMLHSTKQSVSTKRTKRFLSDFKRLLDHVLRIRTNHHAKLTRFDDKLHVAIVNTEMFRPENELHAPLLTWRKSYALKTFQLLHRTDDTGADVTIVTLDHIIAGAFAGVLNVGGYTNRSVRPDLRRADSYVRNLELRVAQAEAEGKLRRPGSVEILVSVTIVCFGRTAGVHVVVVDRDLTRQAREG